MESLNPRLGTIEREVCGLELSMVARIDNWGSLGAHLFEEDVVTQWVIHEPDDRLIFTNAFLADWQVDLYKKGKLFCSDLPYVRPLSDMPNGLRLEADAVTRAIVFKSPDHGYRGALLRRYRDDVLYVWSTRLKDDRWVEIAGRCQDVNEAFERHESTGDVPMVASVAKELRVESYEILEMLTTRMYENGMIDKEEVIDVRNVIDAIIQEVRNI